MTKNKTSKNFGFTLFEMVVVIAIIALIAVIAVPATIGLIQKSNQQNDKVLASTYSSYMQKFATEKVGSAEFYENIDNSGDGSEYAELSQFSGNGAYPGINKLNSMINDADSEEEIWRLVRKQACIAIKAYGNVELADNENYYIHKPLDSDFAFVYYYLTGKVELKKLSDMEKITSQDVKDGAVDTEDYWVYLDREGGSGKASGDVSKSQRDFYVQIYQFGLYPNTPLNGAIVSLKLSDGRVLQATTTSSGLVVLRNVTNELDVSAEMLGAISFPDEEYYPASEDYPDSHVVLEGDYDGIRATKPYIIYLKVGTLGSLQFNEQVKTFNFDTNKTETMSWTIGSEIIGQNNNDTYTSIFESMFTKKESSALGRDEEYLTNLKDNIPLEANPQELLGVNNGMFRFLMYGDYTLDIKDQNNVYLPYKEDITSKVYGIDNTTSPKFEKEGSPYAYPVTLKRTSTHIYGVIASENLLQPLDGTHNIVISETSDKKDESKITIQTYVYAVSENKQHIFKSAALTREPEQVVGPDGKTTYIYEFEISLTNINTPQGASDSSAEKYEIFLATQYGTTTNINNALTLKKLSLNEFPTNSILGDGSYYILKTSSEDFVQVNIDEVAKTEAQIEIYEDNSLYEDNKKYLTYTAYLYRMGYEGSEFVNETTEYTTGLINGSDRRVGSFGQVKKGFYYLVIDYVDNSYGDIGYPFSKNNPQQSNAYIVFVDDDFKFNVIKTYSDKEEQDTQILIRCIPKHSDGYTGFTNKAGMLDKTVFNASTDAAIKFEIYANGQKLVIYENEDERILKNKSRFDIIYDGFSDGTVLITIMDSSITEGLEIRTSVKCFQDTTVMFSDVMSNSSYNKEFIIKRDEVIENSNFTHNADFWFWTKDNTYHWQYCKKCDLTRYNTKHFVDINGAEKVMYFPVTQTDFSSSNENTSGTAQHIKHCTECKLYDVTVGCTIAKDGYETKENTGWSYYYNLSSQNDITHALHEGTMLGGSGKKAYTLTEFLETTPSSEKYHYQYCIDCHQRVNNGAHDFKETKKPTCDEDGLETCSVCSKTRKLNKLNHDYNVVCWYTRECQFDSNNCLFKKARHTCKNCNYVKTFEYKSGNKTVTVDFEYSTVVWRASDIGDGSSGYGKPWRRKYFDPYAHYYSTKNKTHTEQCLQSGADYWGMWCCKCMDDYYNIDTTHAAVYNSATDFEYCDVIINPNLNTQVTSSRGETCKTHNDIIGKNIIRIVATSNGYWKACKDNASTDAKGVMLPITKEGNVELSGSFSEGKSGGHYAPFADESHKEKDTGRSYSQCCRRFTWPTTATSPGSEDKLYASNGSKFDTNWSGEYVCCSVIDVYNY